MQQEEEEEEFDKEQRRRNKQSCSHFPSTCYVTKVGTAVLSIRVQVQVQSFVQLLLEVLNITMIPMITHTQIATVATKRRTIGQQLLILLLLFQFPLLCHAFVTEAVTEATHLVSTRSIGLNITVPQTTTTTVQSWRDSISQVRTGTETETATATTNSTGLVIDNHPNNLVPKTITTAETVRALQDAGTTDMTVSVPYNFAIPDIAMKLIILDDITGLLDYNEFESNLRTILTDHYKQYIRQALVDESLSTSTSPLLSVTSPGSITTTSIDNTAAKSILQTDYLQSVTISTQMLRTPIEVQQDTTTTTTTTSSDNTTTTPAPAVLHFAVMTVVVKKGYVTFQVPATVAAQNPISNIIGIWESNTTNTTRNRNRNIRTKHIRSRILQLQLPSQSTLNDTNSTTTTTTTNTDTTNNTVTQYDPLIYNAIVKAISIEATSARGITVTGGFWKLAYQLNTDKLLVRTGKLQIAFNSISVGEGNVPEAMEQVLAADDDFYQYDGLDDDEQPGLPTTSNNNTTNGTSTNNSTSNSTNTNTDDNKDDDDDGGGRITIMQIILIIVVVVVGIIVLALIAAVAMHCRYVHQKKKDDEEKKVRKKEELKERYVNRLGSAHSLLSGSLGASSRSAYSNNPHLESITTTTNNNNNNDLSGVVNTTTTNQIGYNRSSTRSDDGASNDSYSASSTSNIGIGTGTGTGIPLSQIQQQNASTLPPLIPPSQRRSAAYRSNGSFNNKGSPKKLRRGSDSNHSIGSVTSSASDSFATGSLSSHINQSITVESLDNDSQTSMSLQSLQGGSSTRRQQEHQQQVPLNRTISNKPTFPEGGQQSASSLCSSESELTTPSITGPIIVGNINKNNSGRGKKKNGRKKKNNTGGPNRQSRGFDGDADFFNGEGRLGGGLMDLNISNHSEQSSKSSSSANGFKFMGGSVKLKPIGQNYNHSIMNNQIMDDVANKFATVPNRLQQQQSVSQQQQHQQQQLELIDQLQLRQLHQQQQSTSNSLSSRMVRPSRQAKNSSNIVHLPITEEEYDDDDDDDEDDVDVDVNPDQDSKNSKRSNRSSTSSSSSSSSGNSNSSSNNGPKKHKKLTSSSHKNDRKVQYPQETWVDDELHNGGNSSSVSHDDETTELLLRQEQAPPPHKNRALLNNANHSHNDIRHSEYAFDMNLSQTNGMNDSTVSLDDSQCIDDHGQYRGDVNTDVAFGDYYYTNEHDFNNSNSDGSSRRLQIL